MLGHLKGSGSHVIGSITKRERVSRHVSESVHMLSFIFSLATLNLIRAGTLISPPLDKVTTLVRQDGY